MTMTSVRCHTHTDVFDLTYDQMLASDVHTGLASLSASLQGLRAHLAPPEWKAVCEEARTHPVHDLLLESPFTRRAYSKPRGYAGDAILMDLIYGIEQAGDGLSALGGMLYGYEFDSGCFQSVRKRRAVLAREIDAAAARRQNARVLSVACGHLREVEWSRAVRNGDVAVTAIDQDHDSVAFVRREFAGCHVSAMAASVGDLLRRSLRFTDLDLAYAAGLYDYLDDEVARVLTATLFRMLRPGGRLLIANFTPATHDAGFMEAIMDWHLVYRTADQVRALAASIPPADVAGIEQFSDRNGHVAYMRVEKR